MYSYVCIHMYVFICMYHFSCVVGSKETTGIQLQCIPEKTDTSQMYPEKVIHLSGLILYNKNVLGGVKPK